VVLFKVNLLYFRLRITCYAHARPSDTPKDTLHCIEHFTCAATVIKLLQHTNVLGLVIASSHFASLRLVLRRAGTRMRYRCALPNQFRCQTSRPSFKKAHPKVLFGNLPQWPLQTAQPVP